MKQNGRKDGWSTAIPRFPDCTTDDGRSMFSDDRVKSTNASSIGHPTAVVIGLDYGSEDVLCRHTEQVPQDRN